MFSSVDNSNERKDERRNGQVENIMPPVWHGGGLEMLRSNNEWRHLATTDEQGLLCLTTQLVLSK